jgi:hypothetical protein
MNTDLVEAKKEEEKIISADYTDYADFGLAWDLVEELNTGRAGDDIPSFSGLPNLKPKSA